MKAHRSIWDLLVQMLDTARIRKAPQKDERTASFGPARSFLERSGCGSCPCAVCGKVGFLAYEAAS